MRRMLAADNIETLNRFSVSECRNEFAVASDSDHVLYSYTDLKPDKHVENTMAAVQKWSEKHGAKKGRPTS